MKLTPTLGGSLSGSLGGLTASHNKGGQYLRRRSVPTNPNTARQQTVRSAMGGIVQAWSSTLTESQRQAWRDYASNTPRTDKLGQTINLSGQQWYVACNTPRLQIDAEAGTSLGRIDAAPTNFNTGEAVANVTTFTGVFTSPPGTLDLAGDLAGAAPDDGVVALYIGALQNPGVRFFKGPYQFAATIAISATDTDFENATLALTSAWFSDTVPVAGWDGLYVPLKLIVLYDDGRLSQAYRALTQFTDLTP